MIILCSVHIHVRSQEGAPSDLMYLRFTVHVLGSTRVLHVVRSTPQTTGTQ